MDTSRKISELLQDNAGVGEVLARELHAVQGATLSVHGLTIDFFRQSATRIAAQYTLDLESSDGLRGQQIITVVHFTDGRIARHWRRMRQEAPDAPDPVGQFNLPGARYSETLQSIIQAFPFDARVPGLRKIVAGAPEIRRLASPTDANSIVAWQAEVVRYRPDMRAMARVDFTSSKNGRSKAQCVYAKAYREVEDGQRAYDLLEALAAHAATTNSFDVPMPLAYDPDLRTLLIAEATGDRLLDIIRHSEDEQVPQAVRRAACAVAAMHASAIAPSLLSRTSPDKVMQFTDVAETLVKNFPEHASAVQALTQQIEAVFHPAPPRPTHYDLKQGHILVDQEKVTILDFDKMALGDPLIDVANVVATLGAEREGGARRASRRENLAEIFIEEYFSHAPADWAALFPAHLARATLLEAATTGRGNRGRRSTTHREDRLVSALRRAEEQIAS